MDGLGASRIPPTPGGDSRGPMSQPCLLCLPMHSSCDPMTCPSLLLFGSELPTGSQVSPDRDLGKHWIVSASFGQVRESASKGCIVCATLFTGIMLPCTFWTYETRGYWDAFRDAVQVKVARCGLVSLTFHDKQRRHNYRLGSLSFYSSRMSTGEEDVPFLHSYLGR